MADIKIKIRCSRCLGTGTDENIPCIPCSGSGFIEKDRIDVTDIMALLNKMSTNLDDIMAKLDV